MLLHVSSMEFDQEDVVMEEFLPKFICQNESSKEFNSKYKTLMWKRLIKDLGSETVPPFHYDALKSLKILSREKRDLNELINEDAICILLKYGLKLDTTKQSQVEALSCLSNLLLQVNKVSVLCSQSDILQSLLNKIETYHEGHEEEKMPPLQLILRIGVIITILNPRARDIIVEDCRGNEILLGLYEYLLLNDKSSNRVEALTETSKLLYNIWLSPSSGESCQPHYQKGASLIKKAFTLFDHHSEKDRIVKHSINLLSALPSSQYEHFLEVSSEEEETFGDESIIVPKECLNYLLSHLDDPEYELEESISPSLMFLCQLSRRKRHVRKYLRGIILPPLKDVKNRPEIGNEPRNKLCKLLTSPITSIQTLSSEFLFVLCKEQVNRMVKYTGFGNAAGLLARKGLLSGKSPKADYSDEDSETEEYASNSHKINPVIGCVEKPHSSPFEGMSEERKEYEVMKLVGIIDKLNEQGLIRPAMPGPDGKPVPVEHILQMTEGIEVPKQSDEEHE